METFLFNRISLYNGYILGVIIFIGIATLLIDVPKLKHRKLDKERKIAIGISLVYIIGGLISFITMQIYL